MTALDTLYHKVEKYGNVCVGLDTALEYLPHPLIAAAYDPMQAILNYNCAVVDATEDITACYKVQIAYYEALGLKGLELYAKTLSYIRFKKLLIIADVKRGDIADTAARYAKAHYSGDFEADFVTLSAYMGMDSLAPWVSAAQESGKGAFVLMRTSNAGRQDFQCQKLLAGGSVYEAVGDKLRALASSCRGECGYALFGAVVGCTESEEAAAIRKRYKDLFFLIPGYGVQGGGGKEAALLLDGRGNGGVVNASRAVLKAWKKNERIEGMGKREALLGAMEEVRSFVVTMRDDIRDAVEVLLSKEEIHAKR